MTRQSSGGLRFSLQSHPWICQRRNGTGEEKSTVIYLTVVVEGGAVGGVGAKGGFLFL